MSEGKATFNCVRCGFETDDKTNGCPACGCGLLLPHEKWRNSHLGDLPDMPDGVARRLRGKDGTSPELTMVEKAREHISKTPRPSQELESLEQDIDAEVQQALSADIPLPPVEYLIAEERSLEKKEEKEAQEPALDSQTDLQAETESINDTDIEDLKAASEVEEEIDEIVLDEDEIVLANAAYVSEEETSNAIPQKHSDPLMMELHDTFFKDETVATDPEISLDAIRESIRSSEANRDAVEEAYELPADALEPLQEESLVTTQTEAPSSEDVKDDFEELGDEAEIEPLPTEDAFAESTVSLDSEPGLGIEEALAREKQKEEPRDKNTFGMQREIQTSGFVSSDIEPIEKPVFYDDDGQAVPFIQPEYAEEPALWREPSTLQVLSAGLVDTLLVLICVAPVTIIATVSKQSPVVADSSIMSAIPWHVIWAFWGSAFIFHGLLTFASIYWTGATAGGNLLRISVLSLSDAAKPNPRQTSMLALVSGLGVISLMVGPFFALWLNRRFRGPGHFFAGTVPVIQNTNEA